jgi:hypothetical protein
MNRSARSSCFRQCSTFVTVLLWGLLGSGCGVRSRASEQNESPPSTATAPVEFAGVYRHPEGEDGREGERTRLTITPSGMSISGGDWSNAVTWKSGSGDPRSSWNFECAPESREICTRGSLMRTPQGVIATISGGDEWSESKMTAYGGAWVPVASAAPSTASSTGATQTMPEWLRGTWTLWDESTGCPVSHNLDITLAYAKLTVADRNSEYRERGQRLPPQCPSFSRETVIPVRPGQVVGEQTYQTKNRSGGVQLLVTKNSWGGTVLELTHLGADGSEPQGWSASMFTPGSYNAL